MRVTRTFSDEWISRPENAIRFMAAQHMVVRAVRRLKVWSRIMYGVLLCSMAAAFYVASVQLEVPDAAPDFPYGAWLLCIGLALLPIIHSVYKISRAAKIVNTMRLSCQHEYQQALNGRTVWPST